MHVRGLWEKEYTDMLVYSDFVSPRYTPCILHYDNPLPSVILYYFKKNGWMVMRNRLSQVKNTSFMNMQQE